jgi:uncharacterized protein YkwD
MKRSFSSTWILSIGLSSLLLAGCGGGGGNSDAAATPNVAATDPGAPQATGNTATDGFNWFNYRRQQSGLPALTRNPQIDAAAQNHSSYQATNSVLTHEELSDKPGFTGAVLWDQNTKTGRLATAGYQFTADGYAHGEVISRTGSTSGVRAANDLITAIYHRFVIFEPMFKEAGTGAATGSDGYTYFTTDFVANGLDAGLGKGNFVIYPYANQINVPVNFFSDSEIPDPVPDLNEVGFPISVHADILSTVTVQSFTVKPRNGAALTVRMLTHAMDLQTPESAIAIVPLNGLARSTTYDVEFVGAVDGVPANRAWSFTTQP